MSFDLSLTYAVDFPLPKAIHCIEVSIVTYGTNDGS
jgi:hypothetical protein